MTKEQKECIEKNIDLIESNQWDKFFAGRYPYGIGGVLHAAGIDFMSDMKTVPFCAFDGYTSLTNFIIPDSVTSISARAFADCKSLTNITIPNSVASIGDYAFDGCSSLTSITIPNSVTSIAEGAFYDCSNLDEIIFNGTKTQFKQIKKHRRWIHHTVLVKCSDGDLVYTR